ncbi:hypothetical protein F4779DRAFT_632581 [Xylariaceae sp. FL0662B]|nr:hypothetical protein F4779DRAFT_632581 [Xylariaceae sp. FL0662B]
MDELVQNTLLQPKPKPSKRPYASFLKDFVDPFHASLRPESIHAFVPEGLEFVESGQENRCRSESHLHRSDDGPVPRQLARSAPEIGHTRHVDEFVVLPTPASIGSRSYRATTDDSTSTASVRHPSYRRNNLYSNNIDIRHANTRLPSYISSHIIGISAKRDSPDPSSEQIDRYFSTLETLQKGCTEADMEEFLADTAFPKNSNPTYRHLVGLENSKLSLIANHLVPNNPKSPFRVSQPKSDLLYRYSSDPRDGAFTQSQFLTQASLHQNARFTEVTTQGLGFPFFVIEFKAAGGTREDDPNYYLQRVDAFLLSNPEHFKSFRKRVRNVLDWGKDTRLKQIRDALDIVLEENRKKAAERAKTRQPPSDGSATSRGKKPKSSSRGTDEPYWELDLYPEVNQQD